MSLIVANQETPTTPTTGNTEVFVNTSKQVATVDDVGSVRVSVDRTTAEILSNKSIDDSCKIVYNADASRVVQPDLGSMFPSVILTVAVLQSSNQQLNIPNITVTDTLAVTTLAQDLANKRIAFAAGSTTVPPIQQVSGTLLTTPVAGAVEYDGTVHYATNDATAGRAQHGAFQIFRLSADGAAIGAAIADYFGANSAFNMIASGIYELDFYLWYLKTTAGTVTYTITSSGASVTNLVAWYDQSPVGGIATNAATTGAGVQAATGAATALPVTASLTTAVNHFSHIKVLVENISSAANIRLRATESAGTITPRRGSYATMKRVFAGNVGIFAA